MDIRLIFLNFKRIAQCPPLRAWTASTPAREHVFREGYEGCRCGVTEREDQSVCIDWTWKARGVDPGRQTPRESRTIMPITRRKTATSVPFCFQENRRTRESSGTVPQTNTGGMVE